MARFDISVTKTLRFEGGYTVDTGGSTRYGISQKAFPGEDIQNLTLDRAKVLYRRSYWDPIKGDQIESQQLADALFDFAVNAGITRAVSTVQQILRDRFAESVAVDGVLGVHTLGAMNHHDEWLINPLIEAREAFYRKLAAERPTIYGKYLKGWLPRARSFWFGVSR